MNTNSLKYIFFSSLALAVVASSAVIRAGEGNKTQAKQAGLAVTVGAASLGLGYLAYTAWKRHQRQQCHQLPAQEKWIRLCKAAKKGNVETVNWLIEAGTDLNRLNGLGLSPLMLATKHKHHPIMTALLDAGADINQQSTRGNTALHLACSQANEGAVRVLLAYEPDLDIPNNQQLSPLLSAFGKEKDEIRGEIIRLLLNKGASTEDRPGLPTVVTALRAIYHFNERYHPKVQLRNLLFALQGNVDPNTCAIYSWGNTELEQLKAIINAIAEEWKRTVGDALRNAVIANGVSQASEALILELAAGAQQ